jgi:uncharacterized SAM-binding protein YcdF (DUF218 family)
MSLEWSFIAKKIISIALLPISLGVLLAVIALIYLFKENIKRAKIYLIASLFWITVVSSPPFGSLLLESLENRYPPLIDVPKNIEYILLLGGERERRTWEALRLYHQIPNVKIITSGYAMSGDVSEAEVTAILLRESGVKKEDILMQREAKDTEEEAEAMKKRVGERPFILVTSASHLPRAMQFFKSRGLNPIPAPADLNYQDEDNIYNIFHAKQLKKTERAWHEYFGLLWLKIKS